MAINIATSPAIKPFVQSTFQGCCPGIRKLAPM
jgi:hypothetical protein